MSQDNRSIDYVGAPYNFVPFPDKVLEYQAENLPWHNTVQSSPDKEEGRLYTGEIEYQIISESPIFVGSGVKNDAGNECFYKNADGRYAIPGSTMRGLIRSNVQILSMSSVIDDINDYALLYRTITKGTTKYDYKRKLGAAILPLENGITISILKNVRAGYIKNENGKYHIYDTVINTIGSGNRGTMNYYVLSERKIQKEYSSYLSNEQNKGIGQFAYSFFLNPDGSFFTNHDLRKPFNKKNRTQYEETDNTRYKPYHKKCSYQVNGVNVTAVGVSGQYGYEGYAVSTGKMKMKKAIYIIPAMDSNEKSFDQYHFPIEISKKDLDAFKIDLEKRKTTLNQFGGTEWFDLPGEGEGPRPIFYIWLDSKLYFGFTPYMRLFYDHTIHDGIPDSQKTSRLDYAKALFGFSDKKPGGDSFRSRLSFSDALAEDPVSEFGVQKRILGEPKPTSTLDYVEPKNDNAGNNYNSDDFMIRGIKQYWLHNELSDDNVSSDKADKGFVSSFIPLSKGSRFSGKVRFHNLKQEELGLLLRAMKLDDSSKLNIGKAKAFGFGTVALSIQGVRVLESKKLCDLSNLCLDPYVTMSLNDQEKCIYAYQRIFITDFCKGKTPTSIRIFLLMKDSLFIPDNKDIRWMKLEDYRSRIRPLQKPTDIAKRKSGFDQRLENGCVFTAKVTKIEGKNIKFYIDSIDFYGKFAAEDIKFQQVTRKTLSSVLSKDDMIEVLLVEWNRDNPQLSHWNCTGKR